MNIHEMIFWLTVSHFHIHGSVSWFFSFFRDFYLHFCWFLRPILKSFNQFPTNFVPAHFDMFRPNFGSIFEYFYSQFWRVSTNFFLLFVVNFYKPISTSIWTHFDIFRPNVRSIFEYFYGQFRWVSTNFPPFLKVFLVHLLGPISVIIWEYLGVFIPILN